MAVEQQARPGQPFLAFHLAGMSMLSELLDLVADLLEIQAHAFSIDSRPRNSEHLFEYCTA